MNKITQEVNMNRILNGKKWINEYNLLIDNAIKRKKELEKEQSKYDQEITDILHYVEMIRCDAITSAKLMKCLKILTANRRIIKEELAALRSITSIAHKSKYKNNDTYTFNTDIISRILED